MQRVFCMIHWNGSTYNGWTRSPGGHRRGLPTVILPIRPCIGASSDVISEISRIAPQPLLHPLRGYDIFLTFQCIRETSVSTPCIDISLRDLLREHTSRLIEMAWVEGVTQGGARTAGLSIRPSYAHSLATPRWSPWCFRWLYSP